MKRLGHYRATAGAEPMPDLALEWERLIGSEPAPSARRSAAKPSRSSAATSLDAYWRPFEQGRGREATLEFYRSMDFEKLAPYEGRLGELGVPTLLLWGADDPFARVASAHRFAKEIPGAKVLPIEGAGHFVYDQEPGATTAEVVGFLAGAG